MFSWVRQTIAGPGKVTGRHRPRPRPVEVPLRLHGGRLSVAPAAPEKNLPFSSPSSLESAGRRILQALSGAARWRLPWQRRKMSTLRHASRTRGILAGPKLKPESRDQREAATVQELVWAGGAKLLAWKRVDSRDDARCHRLRESSDSVEGAPLQCGNDHPTGIDTEVLWRAAVAGDQLS